jgi:hypothetical protein
MSIIYINPFQFAAAPSPGYDPDAQAYITAVETADGQALETGVRDAINALVVGFKAQSIWTPAAQLLMPCGPRTLAGALVALKGTPPTNNGFLSGDHNRKTGLGDPSNTSKWLDSNILQNSLPASSHALAWRGAITANSANEILIGRYNDVTNAASSLLSLDGWASYVSGRAFRSGVTYFTNFPVSKSTAAASCLIGSRVASNSASLYVDSNAAIINTANIATGFQAQSLGWFALNAQSGAIQVPSKDRLQVGGIYSSDLNATQAAAFRTLTQTYVNAIDAAIP